MMEQVFLLTPPDLVAYLKMFYTCTTPSTVSDKVRYFIACVTFIHYYILY